MSKTLSRQTARKYAVSMAVFSATVGLSTVVLSQRVSANSVNDYIKSKVANNNWKGANEILAHRFGQIPYRYAYRGGVGHPEGVIVHDTANDSDHNQSANEISYMINNAQNAFVHGFVNGNPSSSDGDNSGSVAVADTDYLAWGAGPTANSRYMQTEQSRVDTKDQFAQELLNLATTQSAYLKQYGYKPVLGQTVFSHAMTSALFRETDHTDPNQYWADMARQHFGSTYTMNDYIQLLQAVYSGTLVPTPVKHATLTQKYVDATTGKEIHAQETYTRNVGDTITATARNVDGYFTPSAQTVKIGDNGSTVTFKYTKLYDMTDVKDLDQFGTINSSSRNDGMYANAPYGVQSYNFVANTNSYNGWNGHIMKSAKANGVTFYQVNLNGMTLWIDARAFTNIHATPQVVSENTKTQYSHIRASAQDIRTGDDPRWNKQSAYADGNAVINSNSAHSDSVKVTDVRTYQYEAGDSEFNLSAKNQKTWVRLSQNNHDLGWTPAYNLTTTVDDGSAKPMPTPDPTPKPDPTPTPTPKPTNKVKITIKYVDENGLGIKSDTTTSVDTGKSTTIKPDDIADYTAPNAQTVDGSKDQTVTFKYTYKYQNIKKYAINAGTLNTNQKTFVNNILPDVVTIAGDNDLYKSVMLAQAVSESGYGTSELATKANALFGIKAGSDWHGKTYTKDTQEIVNGKTTTVKGTFRAYDSFNDSLKDYANKLKSGSSNGDKDFYKNVFKSNAPTYVDALMVGLQGKYSTNTDYGTNLNNTINTLEAYRLDGQTVPASTNGALTINYQDENGKTISATKMASITIGTVGTVEPIAISNYDKPANQTYTMTSKGAIITFKYHTSVSATKDGSIKNGTWQTNGSKESQIYSDNILSKPVANTFIKAGANVTVGASFTIKGGSHDGQQALLVSQNGKQIGYVVADDFSKTESTKATKDSSIDNGTWQTAKNDKTTLYSDDTLKNKISQTVSGNVKVIDQYHLNDKDTTKVLAISQNGKQIGYAKADDFKRTVAVIKTDKKTSWTKIKQDTTIYSDDLGQHSKGNTNSMRSKSITVDTVVTLNTGNKMLHFTQQGVVPLNGWINSDSVEKSY